VQLQVTAKKGHSGTHGWVALDEFMFIASSGESNCNIEPPLASPEGANPGSFRLENVFLLMTFDAN
jgi:hypothetical protein